MTVFLLLVACATEHKQTVTTSIIEGGGTASTFYVLVSEQTYDTASWPGGSITSLVSDDATLVRCDVTAVDHRRQTSCDAAITLDQASDAAHRPISFTTRSADMPQGSDPAKRCAALRKRLDQIIATGTLPSELPSLPPECQ
jgi:hypothetical protein